MSLIRKHRAVLQAWACLALVCTPCGVRYQLYFAVTAATAVQVVQNCSNIVE